MKILLFGSDEPAIAAILCEIKKAGHFITQIVDDPAELISEIARTTPHLLVTHAQGGNFLPVSTTVPEVFPDLPLCLLSGETDTAVWQASLREALDRPVSQSTPRPYAEGNRLVCHDASLHAFWKGKLNRPERTEGWERICSQQEARFVLHLQTARKNHATAKNYFACLSMQQAGLDQELAYRLSHGSYKALSWSRDLAVKWLALLAHYVPDAELEYLPLPGTPGPAIDYVHHKISVEGMYAVALVLLSGIKPSIQHVIETHITARFEGQDDNALLELSLQLYGLAKFLEQVGRAQIELMDVWLDPAIVGRTEGQHVPRGEHRNAGIYRDFYDLKFIVLSPEPLASILRGFHAGTTSVEERRYFPTFAEFRRLCRHVPSASEDSAAQSDAMDASEFGP
jgi:hypothetical protein